MGKKFDKNEFEKETTEEFLAFKNDMEETINQKLNKKIDYKEIDDLDKKIFNLLENLGYQKETMKIKPAGFDFIKFVQPNIFYFIEDKIKDDKNYILSIYKFMTKVFESYPQFKSNKINELHIVYLMEFPVVNIFLFLENLTKNFVVNLYMDKEFKSDLIENNPNEYYNVTDTFKNLNIKTLEEAEKKGFIKKQKIEK